MKRRNAIRVISLLSSVILVITGFLIKSKKENKEYMLQLQNTYSKSLSDLSASANNIAITLNKAKFANDSAILGEMSAKLLTEAEISKNALSQLPKTSELTTLNRFYSQIGNYAMSVAKNFAESENVSSNIEVLANTATVIAQAISNAQVTHNNPEYWAYEVSQSISQHAELETLSASLENLENELTDFPTLVYDGPYSDHLLEKEPEMLKGAELVSKNTAREKASIVAECQLNDLEYDGEIAGHIPSFRFKTANFSVCITKNGAIPLSYLKTREIGENILTYEQALSKAKRYLSKLEMNNFIETYYSQSEGICVINFAFLDGETICYTDLVKVGVAMDNGEIMLFESAGYITNHKDRAFETPLHTPEEAETLLSENLTLNGTALALIPSSSMTEVRCYEFSCSSGEDEVLIYINASTLKQEDILILLKSDNGILVK